MIRLSIAFSLLLCIAVPSIADQGEPVALIRDGENSIVVETMGDFQLRLSHADEGWKYSVKQGDEKPTTGTGKAGDQLLIDRHPNQSKLSIVNPMTASRGSRLKSSANVLKLQFKSDRAMVTVDGVRVVVVVENFDGSNGNWVHGADALAVIGKPKSTESIIEIANRESVKTLVLSKSAKQHATAKTIGNNVALVATDSSKEAKLRVVALDAKPYQLSDELTQLFDRKEVACRASQDVFEKLSVKQMNFKPSNGTHTPRWNTEHMMGRELLFFSQIFNAVDPTIPVMNLNPRQMPKDYEYKHENWTGAEEARQMERVTKFTRRHAHLLDGIDLDQKAPGSGWTLRRLLLQMERHYNDHTANVKKKFELPDFPRE